MNTTRNRTTHATFVFFEDARRGFDAFLGQLWHGANQVRPDVRVIMVCGCRSGSSPRPTHAAEMGFVVTRAL